MSLTLFVATHVIILTSDLSTGCLTARLHRKILNPPRPSKTTKEDRTYVTLRSATTSCDVLSFGSWLEPRNIFAARQLIYTSELLRYL